MRSALEAWWDRGTESYYTKPLRPIPYDGASWACYTLFFGIVGLVDPRYTVKKVHPGPVVFKLLELWQDAKKSKIQVG